MLSQEDDEILIRVGPGTMLGDLIRQYWIAIVRAAVPGQPPKSAFGAG